MHTKIQRKRLITIIFILFPSTKVLVNLENIKQIKPVNAVHINSKLNKKNS